MTKKKPKSVVTIPEVSRASAPFRDLSIGTEFTFNHCEGNSSGPYIKLPEFTVESHRPAGGFRRNALCLKDDRSSRLSPDTKCFFEAPWCDFDEIPEDCFFICEDSDSLCYKPSVGHYAGGAAYLILPHDSEGCSHSSAPPEGVCRIVNLTATPASP